MEGHWIKEAVPVTVWAASVGLTVTVSALHTLMEVTSSNYFAHLHVVVTLPHLCISISIVLYSCQDIVHLRSETTMGLRRGSAHVTVCMRGTWQQELI